MLKVATLTKPLFLQLLVLLRRVLHITRESLHKSSASPTNRSQAPHVQASARTQRMTRDKQWDGGPCRSRPPVPAPVSLDREGTCGHAIRRSWCLQSPSGRPPASPWLQDPGD